MRGRIGGENELELHVPDIAPVGQHHEMCGLARDSGLVMYQTTQTPVISAPKRIHLHELTRKFWHSQRSPPWRGGDLNPCFVQESGRVLALHVRESGPGLSGDGPFGPVLASGTLRGHQLWNTGEQVSFPDKKEAHADHISVPRSPIPAFTGILWRCDALSYCSRLTNWEGLETCKDGAQRSFWGVWNVLLVFSRCWWQPVFKLYEESESWITTIWASFCMYGILQ